LYFFSLLLLLFKTNTNIIHYKLFTCQVLTLNYFCKELNGPVVVLEHPCPLARLVRGHQDEQQETPRKGPRSPVERF
jgi:hypothetical protein